MKIKTAELIDTALDWAVAECNYVTYYFDHKGRLMEERGDLSWVYAPSTSWAQGGPIIERIKGFQFKQWLESHPESCCEAHIHNYEGDWIQFGPTPLIAAMRCYVASKLGDTVDVPEELK